MGTTAGLVLQGGGARGAYQAGVLAGISEILDCRALPFPVISGTSVGAINALPLASGAHDFNKSCSNLVNLWSDIRSDQVFKTGWLELGACSWRMLQAATGHRFARSGRPIFLLNNAPLEELLAKHYDKRAVKLALRRGNLQALAISASRLGTGEAVSFCQSVDQIMPWQRARRLGVPTKIEIRHVMASSSLPLVFPPVAIESNWYVDGALRLNAPLSPAIRMGADKLMVIGVRDHERDSAGIDQKKPPNLGETLGDALDVLFNDNLDEDLERVMRLNKLLDSLDPESRQSANLRRIDVLEISPSRDLRAIAAEHRRSMPQSLQMILRMIGGFRHDSRLASYLLFEPNYTRALINLGHHDAMARADDIKAFMAES